MSKHLIWLAPLILAGCGEKVVEAENVSVAEVANQVEQAGLNDVAMRPGQWTANVKLNNIGAPGTPPEAERKLRESVGRSNTVTTCLTEEEAKKPFDRFFQGLDQSCRYDRFTMGRGKVDSQVVCTNGGLTRTMSMRGTYDADSYQLLMDTKASGTGPMKELTMTMSLEAKRVGECPVGETQ